MPKKNGGATDLKRSSNGRLYKFFVPDGCTGGSMDGLADTLIGFSEVREVIISDAKDGFLVKVWFMEGRKPRYPTAYIVKYVSRDFGRVVSK